MMKIYRYGYLICLLVFSCHANTNISIELSDGSSFDSVKIISVDSFSYGTLTEIQIFEKIPFKLKNKNKTFDKLLDVDGNLFYFSSEKGASKAYTSSGNEVELFIKPTVGDEAKIQALLQQLLPKFKTKTKHKRKIYLISSVSDYCDDCWTNKGCRLHGCKKYCNWDTGYKCCKNENGRTCNR